MQIKSDCEYNNEYFGSNIIALSKILFLSRKVNKLKALLLLLREMKSKDEKRENGVGAEMHPVRGEVRERG